MLLPRTEFTTTPSVDEGRYLTINDSRRLVARERAGRLEALQKSQKRATTETEPIKAKPVRIHAESSLSS